MLFKLPFKLLKLLLHPRALVGIAAGAGAAYYLDPDRGRARRARLSDQFGAKARSTQRQATKQAVDVSNRARGTVAEKVPSFGPRPTGRTLADKVSSEVLRSDRYPAGAVNVDAVDHTVTLRGQLGNEELIRQLEEEVSRLEGVELVDSYLHVVGTEPPNVARALEASRQAAR